MRTLDSVQSYITATSNSKASERAGSGLWMLAMSRAGSLVGALSPGEISAPLLSESNEGGTFRVSCYVQARTILATEYHCAR
jgi:hypothetical protein